MTDSPESFSAGAQGLGYLFQPRFALLRMLQLDESTKVFIEKQDDLEFVDSAGEKTLASLKHKAEGDTLTDLATDFWKSVRVWLASYVLDKTADLRFFLFTTAEIDSDFLELFLPDDVKDAVKAKNLGSEADSVLAKTDSKVILKTKTEFDKLTPAEKDDFLSRVVIFDSTQRISDIPDLIKGKHMRTISQVARGPVLERLEGWWHNEIIALLTKKRTSPISGFEVSDKLCAIADEYKSDNLPITFRNKKPEKIDADADNRMFVRQLKELSLGTDRITFAIIDYYRAFEQRSQWARENLLGATEIEDYESKLTEEWARFKAIFCENIDKSTAETELQRIGKDLYKWAETDCHHIKIRNRVEEPYVVRGGFHILANGDPPRVHWHPMFLDRLKQVLGADQ